MRASELVERRERESDLNAVEPKTVEIGLTGQTGCPDRSDRSGPGWQVKIVWFSVLPRGLKLMTMINLISKD